MSYMERKIKEFHTHIQSTDSNEWVITHNLGRRPIVNVFSVVDAVEVIVMPSQVEVVDLNVCKLVFNNPISGSAEIF